MAAAFIELQLAGLGDDTSSSDEGYENYLVGLQRNLRDHSNPFELPEARFIELFRFPREVMQNVCQLLEPHLSVASRRTRIPPNFRVLTAMRFFATGSYQRTIGQGVVSNMSQTQVHRCIVEVSDAINEHLAEELIRFPSQEEYLPIKQTFMDKFHMPGVIGVIDGTHVAITNPGVEREHNYFNRRGFHSKNVMIICDLNYKILAINAGYAGAIHDAFIWRASSIRTELQRRFQDGSRHSWLLGDSGYALEPFLMTPVRNPPDGSPESRYNEIHRMARCVVERCIGNWKMRFRCILKDRVLKYSPQRAGSIINACAVLHNIAVAHRLPIEDEYVPDDDDDDDDIVEPIEDNLPAEAFRQELIANMF